MEKDMEGYIQYVLPSQGNETDHTGVERKL